MGGREVGGLANQLAAHMDFAADDVDRVQRFWDSPTIATEPGLKAVDLFDAIHDGRIKAVWIMATNPAVSLPNSDKVRQALSQCDFVVVSDYVDNDTAQFAHIKLPTTAWGEKDGTVTNSERRISRQRPLRAPIGDAKHDWWQLTQVAQRMGFAEHFNYQQPADIFREHAALSGFENSEEQRLRDFDISLLADLSNDEYDAFTPTQWPINAANPKGTERLFTDNQFYTPNRRAQFLSGDAQHQVLNVNQQHPLLLNTGRIRDQWHTMTRTGTAVKLHSHIDVPYIEMHPDDVQRYNLTTGEFATLSNDYGQFIGKINENDGIGIGNIFAPIHWTDEFAKLGVISAVVSPTVDPFSGQPESKATPVAIKAFTAHRWATLAVDNAFVTNINTDDFAYWVKSPCHSGVRFLVAVDEQFSWSDYLGALKQSQGLSSSGSSSVDIHEIKFDDQFNHDERIVWLKENDVQLALYSHQQAEQLPSGIWLASLLDQAVTEQPYQLIMGEQSAATTMVCTCFQVDENSIIEAINEGCSSPELLGEKLQCGTNCGSCIPELKSLIADHQNKTH